MCWSYQWQYHILLEIEKKEEMSFGWIKCKTEHVINFNDGFDSGNFKILNF